MQKWSARRLVAWGAAGLVAGCGPKVAAVDIGMAGTSHVRVIPLLAELKHEEEGWITVELAERSPGPAGEPVRLATEDLPTGRYEALRLVYRAYPGDPRVLSRREQIGGAGDRPGGVEAIRPGYGPRWEEEQATFFQRFCIRDDSDEIEVRVLPVNPASGGTLQGDIRAPGC